MDPQRLPDVFVQLGFVPRRLFGQGTAMDSHDGDLILLDGVHSNFLLSIRIALPPGGDDTYRGWAWSSHVLQHVEVSPDTGLIRVRRWDEPGKARRFDLSEVERLPARFVDRLAPDGPSRRASVIDRSLALL